MQHVLNHQRLAGGAAALSLLLPFAVAAEPALKGTVVATLPGRSFAILEYGGQSVLVHAGATIPGVGVLVRVGPKSVVLQRGGSMVELSLGGGMQPAASTSVAAARLPTPSPAPVLAVPMVTEAVPETPPDRSYLNVNGDRTPYPQIP